MFNVSVTTFCLTPNPATLLFPSLLLTVLNGLERNTSLVDCFMTNSSVFYVYFVERDMWQLVNKSKAFKAKIYRIVIIC